MKRQENMEIEERTSEKNVKEPEEAAGDEEIIEVGDTELGGDDEFWNKRL